MFFRSESRLGSPRDAPTSPGPADYQPHGFPHSNTARGTTAPFKSKEERFRDDVEVATGAAVGPGSYDVEGFLAIGSEGTRTLNASAAFKSSSQRMTLDEDQRDFPGPGHYDLDSVSFSHLF